MTNKHRALWNLIVLTHHVPTWNFQMFTALMKARTPALRYQFLCKQMREPNGAHLNLTKERWDKLFGLCEEQVERVLKSFGIAATFNRLNLKQPVRIVYTPVDHRQEMVDLSDFLYAKM